MTMIKRYWNKGRKQRRRVIIWGIVLLLLLFFLRDDYQPALLFLRKYVFIILVCGLFLLWTITKFRSAPSAGRRLLILLGIIGFFATLWFFGWKVELYKYMQTYNVFNNLNRVEISELPLTQNERIQRSGDSPGLRSVHYGQHEIGLPREQYL